MNAMPAQTVRHFLDLSEIPASELRRILDHAKAMKAARRAGKTERPLAGKTLATIFDRPSTRTRISFDLAMRQLGGETLMLTGQEMQLGRGESIADTARVLSRFVDAIMIRILGHDDMRELAAYASVPVINGLTKLSHPCQVMADVMTFEEHRGPIAGRTLAWTGDANNVLTSLIHAAQRFGFTLNIATPAEFAPGAAIMDWAKANGAQVNLTRDPFAAVYQVNAKLMSAAAKDAVFMHCLPAHRGEEVTDDVIDGPQSVVFDEAENRLHAQKGVLAWCLGASA